ncbi:hypothetical protein [Candidatus Tokpelaia sp.]|nr:hypothetical protein [Candidatus Tokpelaia sp.]
MPVNIVRPHSMDNKKATMAQGLWLWGVDVCLAGFAFAGFLCL